LNSGRSSSITPTIHDLTTNFFFDELDAVFAILLPKIPTDRSSDPTNFADVAMISFHYKATRWAGWGSFSLRRPQPRPELFRLHDALSHCMSFFFVLSMVDRRSKTVPSSVESLWCVRAIDAHSGMPIPYVYHLVSLVFSTAFRTCMAVAQRCLHRACFFFSPGA